MTRLLIFDWDGTLSDSLARIVECLQLAARDVDVPIPSVSASRDIIGLGLREALATLFPGISDAAIDRLRESYSGHYLSQDAAPAPLFPNVMETLIRLEEAGYLLAVATGKSRRGLDRVLRAQGLSGFFHASRCADETASKPNPLMVEELLDFLDVQPEQAVVIGDTEYDMEMARQAGVPRIGVSYGAHNVERLYPYDLQGCLDYFPQILEYLNNK